MKTKKCSNKNCDNPIKLLLEFTKDKNCKDGLRSWCKECNKNQQKEYYERNKGKIKEYCEENRREISKRQKEHYKKFPWKRTLYNIKQRCENPNDDRYHRYGGRGIECLITEDELKELWFRDKAYLMDKPSIDREDNDGDYTFDNCRFIEMNINSSKDKGKTVLQFDLDGKFIREWRSTMEVERKLKIFSISTVALGKRKTAGGFIWRYKS